MMTMIQWQQCVTNVWHHIFVGLPPFLILHCLPLHLFFFITVFFIPKASLTLSVQIYLWGRNATRTQTRATRPRLRCLLPSRRQHPKTSSRKTLVQFTIRSLCRCSGSQRAPKYQDATLCQNQERFGERSRANLLSLHGCSFQLFSPSESSLARLVIHFSFTTSQL